MNRTCRIPSLVTITDRFFALRFCTRPKTLLFCQGIYKLDIFISRRDRRDKEEVIGNLLNLGRFSPDKLAGGRHL